MDPQPDNDIVEALSDVFGRLMRLTTNDWISLVISTAQVKLIFVLHFGGTHTVNQLAERLNIKQSTASHLVEKLVQAGYVRRIDSTRDRRIIELHLTEQGRALGDRLSGITHKGMIAEWVAQLTEAQRAAFRDILSSLLGAIGPEKA